MIDFRKKIVPALAGSALALCVAGPATAIDVSLGGISVSVGGNDDGGLGASVDASVGGIDAGVSTSIGGNGISADIGLGTGGDATAGGGGTGGGSGTGTGSDGAGGNGSSIGGRSVSDIVRNMSDDEVVRNKKSCRGILLDPNAYKWDLVQLCKVLAQVN